MKSIQFETSTYCNAKCDFCPRYEMTRPMGYMSDELFHKIIKEAKELGYEEYCPFLNGEPFIFPKIWDWLDYMQKEGVKVTLYTNGEYMDVDRLRKYDNIHLINVSINAATKEMYDKIMRGPDFDKVVANTKKLIEKPFCKIKIGFVKTPENYCEKGKFRDMWGEYANFVPYANWTGDRKSPNKDDKQKRTCSRVARTTIVLWDGRVALCCMDYDGKVIFGDLNKDSLKDIENRKRVLIKQHKNNNFSMHPCNVCNYNYM